MERIITLYKTQETYFDKEFKNKKHDHSATDEKNLHLFLRLYDIFGSSTVIFVCNFDGAKLLSMGGKNKRRYRLRSLDKSREDTMAPPRRDEGFQIYI